MSAPPPEKRRFCAEPTVPERPVDNNIDPFRLELVRVSEKKWANGTTLRYYFFQDPPWASNDVQMQAVRNAFDTWKGLGVGLNFLEVDDREEAEIRIGFDWRDGSWSYVGRDIIDHPPAANPDARTMNFGWDLTTPHGRDTALHEIGHTLGFPHEHQNPKAGIVWNERAVLDEFSGPPNNWSESQIRFNILRKLPMGDVTGSAWDPDSIMHYGFGPGLILKPEQLGRTGLDPSPGLSDADMTEVRRFYPPLKTRIPELKPFESRRISLDPSEQVDFQIKPSASRTYTIQTFGESDVVAVLFAEDATGELRYVDGDDDSGADRNARIEVRLERGRSYVLRVRMYWSFRKGESAVMLW